MKHNLKTLLDEIRTVDAKPKIECSRKEALTWIFLKVKQMEEALRQKEEYRAKWRAKCEEKYPKISEKTITSPKEFSKGYYFYLRGRTDEAKEVLGDSP